jgi:hypothetical protein
MPTYVPTAREEGETLYEYLERRQRELENIAAALNLELEGVSSELAHVKSARRQIADLPSFGRTPKPPAEPSNKLMNALQIGATSNASVEGFFPGAHNALIVGPTIKQQIMKAMSSSVFLLGGASASDIRQYILDVFGRDVSPTSLSPQLSRLKADGMLSQDGDRWRITPTGSMRTQMGESYFGPAVRVSEPPTIRDMVLRALWTSYRKNGATQAELREFINDSYGYDVDSTSLSAEITRLRAEALVKQKGGPDNWRLTVSAINQFRDDLRYGPDYTPDQKADQD